jgi:hypothetical protein
MNLVTSTVLIDFFLLFMIYFSRNNNLEFRHVIKIFAVVFKFAHFYVVVELLKFVNSTL